MLWWKDNHHILLSIDRKTQWVEKKTPASLIYSRTFMNISQFSIATNGEMKAFPPRFIARHLYTLSSLPFKIVLMW